MERTLVWAHRGASAYAPENTMEAFREAAKMGADGIELDVQMSKDGRLVVIHDETVKRVSGKSGWVKDLTLLELKALNVNKTRPAYKNVQIPTLEEVYDWIKETAMTVNVELKTGAVPYLEIEEQALKLAEQVGVRDRVMYSSFNHHTLQRIKHLDSGAKTGMLYSDGLIDPIYYGIKVVGADALHPAIKNTQYPGFLQECRRQNVKLNVWTVNAEMYMRMLCKERVNALITNYPDKAKEISREYMKK